MSRPLRIEYPGAFYHVMNRGLEKRCIFPEKQFHRLIFKNTLQEAVQKWKIKIHAYSLMDNHYHLLIETPLGNLSRSMRHIDGVYTQRLNRVLSRDGPIFRGRYKSILVQQDRYFLELVRYIHLNGVRAGLYRVPSEDENASHRDYLNPHEAPEWLEREVTLSYFQGMGKTAIQKLNTFVLGGITTELENILSKERWPAVLGTKKFVDDIKDRYLSDPNHIHPEIPEKRVMVQNTLLPPEFVIEIVSKYFTGKGSRPEKGKAGRLRRWITVWALREWSQISFYQIGSMLGEKRGRSIEKFFNRNDFRNSKVKNKLEEKLKKCRM